MLFKVCKRKFTFKTILIIYKNIQGCQNSDICSGIFSSANSVDYGENPSLQPAPPYSPPATAQADTSNTQQSAPPPSVSRVDRYSVIANAYDGRKPSLYVQYPTLNLNLNLSLSFKLLLTFSGILLSLDLVLFIYRMIRLCGAAGRAIEGDYEVLETNEILYTSDRVPVNYIYKEPITQRFCDCFVKGVVKVNGFIVTLILKWPMIVYAFQIIILLAFLGVILFGLIIVISLILTDGFIENLGISENFKKLNILNIY